jgi:RimJ/RimL family protein N-acetyltransferase
MDVSIRPIRLEDVESFRECVDIVAREKIYIAVSEAPPLVPMRNYVPTRSRKEILWLVACDGERVVGWCDIRPSREHALRHCGSVALGLLLEYRGKGLGRRLLDQCVDVAANHRGLSRIELEVRVDNERAARAYRAAGFRIEGRKRLRMQVDEQYIDTFVKAKLLQL